MKFNLTLLFLGLMLSVSAQFNQQRVYSTFDNLPLAKADTFDNGVDTSGGFMHAGRHFVNSYNHGWQSWSGFALSNMTDDTTRGFKNQYSSVTGSGLSNTSNYLVAYESPVIVFDKPTPISGAYFTNSTYAYYEMLEGGYGKIFGGASGNDPDSFKLIITSYLEGSEVAKTELFLADFRNSDNSKDYILKDWVYVDFNNDPYMDESMDSIVFSFESSDTSQWGIKTPAYFIMDDFNAISKAEYPKSFVFDADTFDNGSDNSGGFSINHLYFPNNYNSQYNSWSGWSVSSMHDTVTQGFGNQYSAVGGKLASTGGLIEQPFHMVNSGVNNVIRTPYYETESWGEYIYKIVPDFPTTSQFAICNATYAYHDMLNGSGFSKKFGGPSGTDPDYLRVIVDGTDRKDSVLFSDTIYLADFRSSNSAEDYVLKDWVYFYPEVPCNKLKFKMESTDVGQYGMNTPSYFCLALSNTAVDATSKIEKLKLDVYPNPTNGQLTIKTDDVVDRVSIFSANGQEVQTWLQKGSLVQLDISELPQGVYFVKVNSSKTSATKKIIKY